MNFNSLLSILHPLLKNVNSEFEFIYKKYCYCPNEYVTLILECSKILAQNTNYNISLSSISIFVLSILMGGMYMKRKVAFGLVATMLCANLVGCSFKNEEKRNDGTFDDKIEKEIISSGNESVKEIKSSGDENTEEITQNFKLSESVAQKYIQIIKDAEAGKLKFDEDGIEYGIPQDLRCNLIYFNEDDIPELIIEDLSHYIQIFGVKDNEIVSSERLGYGTHGAGYTYAEKNSVIYTNSNDMTGLVVGVYTYKYDTNLQVETSLTAITEGIPLKKTDEEYNSVQEYLKEYGGYYYNDQKITEDEYNKKLKEFAPRDQSKDLTNNTKTASEIITLIENSIKN